MSRSILEMGAPIFSGGLSQTNKQDFEDVQKGAFKIILRGHYQSYDNALEVLEEKTLESRRDDISLKFAKKSVNHPKMKHLFQLKDDKRTRSEPAYFEPQFINARGFNGPVNYLIQLLNNISK